MSPADWPEAPIPDHYDVTNEHGGKIGELRPRTDYADGAASFLTGLVVFAVVGVFILWFRLLFKYPKVMIPVTLVGIFIVAMSSNSSPQPTRIVAANALPVATEVSAAMIIAVTAIPTAPAYPTSTFAMPTSSPTPAVMWVVVGNTGGDGVYVRRSPKMSDKLIAWPDGTKLIIVGPEIDGDGHHWKNVVDPKGNTGWVPGEYVIQSKP